MPKNEFKMSTFYIWFFVWGRAVTMGNKVIVAHSMHNFVPVIPLQTWDGTRKFHRMIIAINCKRTACILIFMCSFGDNLTMQNVVRVHDYRTCLSIKPIIILHGIFLLFVLNYYHTTFQFWFIPHLFLRLRE